MIASKADLRGYWDEISSSRDFLTTVPSYTHIGYPLRRLCHSLIAFTIARRGQAPEKETTIDLYFLRSIDEGTVNIPYFLAQYLFRYAEGSKQGARMSRGHFITRLAEHFGLITEESIRGLTVVVHDLTMIDMDELVKLHICERLLDIPKWVAPGPERQQVGAAVRDAQVDP
ncbi:hypothetical protein Tco_0051068 [Tanacetum coccineum]